MSPPDMWAHALVRPGQLSPTRIPRATLSPEGRGDALVRTVAGGICGSDAPFFLGAINRWSGDPVGPVRNAGFPMHEVVGEVVATRDTDLAVGQMVVGWATRFDGIAEYVTTEASSLWAYDAALDPGHAVLIQPLACVIHAVDRLGSLTGAKCAVLGQGAVGMLFSSVLKARGASSVTAVDRRDLASTASGLGVDAFVCADTSEWTNDAAGTATFDVVIEAVGHQTLTLQHAINAAADGARVFYFGVPDDPVYPIDMERMIRKHLTLMSGGTRDRRRMLKEAEDYLRERPELATTLVSHRYPVDRVQEAYDLSFRSASDRLKVVVDMA